MASNGYMFTRGHATTESDTWVDAILEGSDDVKDSTSWTGASADTLIAYATAADVVIVNSTDAVQVGYVTTAGGYNSVVKVGDYLYLGTPAGGVDRLDISTTDMQSANGDLSADLDSGYLDDGTSPALYNDNVRALHGWTDGSSNPWLAVLVEDSTSTVQDGRVCIVDIDGGTCYYSGVYFDYRHAAAFAGIDDTIYAASGNFVYAKHDCESIAASDWSFEATPVGTFADDLSGNDGVGWMKNTDGAAGSGAAFAGGVATVTAKTAADNAFVYSLITRTMHVVGDFALAFKFDNATMPTITANDREAGFRLRVKTVDDEYVDLDMARYRTAGTTFNKIRWTDYHTGWTETDGSDDVFWFMIARTGSDFTCYYRDGDTGAYTTLGTFAALSAQPVFYAQVWAFTDVLNDCSEGDWAQSCDILECVWETGTVACPDIYADMPSGKEITGLAVSEDTSEADTNSLFIVADGDVFVLDTDETTPASSEVDAVLTELTSLDEAGSYELVACSWDASRSASTPAGHLVASHATGIDYADLTALTPGTDRAFTASSGQPLVDADVQSLVIGASFVYGTDGGAGWVSPDFTALAARTHYKTEGGYTVQLAWQVPTKANYEYSYIQRRKNSGTWYTLHDAGFTPTDTDPKEFDGTVGETGFSDESLTSSDKGVYEYAITHTDDSGNETDGTDSAGEYVTAFLDTPVITGVSIDAGASSTLSAGVAVAVTGHSGTSSLSTTIDASEPGMDRFWLQLREQGGAWSPYLLYDDTDTYDVELTNTEGTKTVEARFLTEGEITGSNTGSDTIYLGPETPSGAATTDEEKFIIAGPFRSDDSDVDITIIEDGLGVDNTDFPVANMQDPRLGVKAKSNSFPSAIGEYVHVKFDLQSSLHNVRFVAIGAHNLGVLNAAKHTTTIGVSADDATYTSYNIDALLDDDWIILDLKQSGTIPVARYYKLKIECIDTAAISPTALEIGRFVLAASADLVKPTYNPDVAMRFGPTRVGTEHQTPEGRYVANPRTAYKASLNLTDFSAADRNALISQYVASHANNPVLLMLRPDRIPKAATTVVNTYPGKLKQALYAWFDDAEMLWNESHNENSSVALSFTEVTGGD
jgi:hypothetical protein